MNLLARCTARYVLSGCHSLAGSSSKYPLDHFLEDVCKLRRQGIGNRSGNDNSINRIVHVECLTDLPSDLDIFKPQVARVADEKSSLRHLRDIVRHLGIA